MDNNFNSSVPSAPPQREGRSAGSLAAALVVLAVIVLGAFYFWGERAMDSENNELDNINVQSSSDAAADIEADLNSTDVNGVDYDLDPDNFNAS